MHFCRSCIDPFQIGHKRLYLFIGYILCGIPNLMDDALLDLCLGENGFNCLGKACQAVYTCDQDILHASVLQTV